MHDHIINLIWHCISSSSLDILWNGVSTGEFSPSRGTRQGDPLSPYLFVICMERLSHLISLAVEQGRWKLVVLSRGGPPISHLCFVDDLFLFAEASMEHVPIIRACLEVFCASSSQKVSL